MDTHETAAAASDHDDLDPGIARALTNLDCGLSMLAHAGRDLDGLDEAADYAWDFHRQRVLSAWDSLRDRLGHPTTPDLLDRDRLADCGGPAALLKAG